jgi:diaminopimelate epimerase
MKAQFWKAYAEGNSYVILDHRAPVTRLLPWSVDQRQGIGGDGVLLVQWHAGDAWMRIFNADGTEAPMCGNGARCVAALAIATGRAHAIVTVSCRGGTITHRLDARDPYTLTGTMQVAADPLIRREQHVFHLDLGTPHCVIFRNLADLVPERDGPRWERTRPGGTNVMFAHVRRPGELDVVPWERGVGATAGCATGAAAAAIAAARMAPDWPARSVVFQPGGSVEVAWRDRDLTLDIRGTVRIIAEGTLDVPEGSKLVAAARADR